MVFGIPSQKVNIMFDTGSAWTWLYTLEGCQENGNKCPGVDKYSENISGTESINTSDVREMSLEYELGEVSGSLISDKFCFTPNNSTACLADPITFLGVSSALNMN